MGLSARSYAHLDHENPYEAQSGLNFFKTSVIWAKIFRWEFWPFWVFYFPMFFYWMWITIRTRSFFFFTAANPGMEFGGLVGGSKYKILEKIPKEYVPKTYLLKPGISKDAFLKRLKEETLKLPVILKPEIGERGFLVELIKTEQELSSYLKNVKVDFMVQEFVSYPVELGVFYYRHPDQKKGTVSSVVIKELLSVTGDGVKTVRELMGKNVRAKMHIASLDAKDERLLNFRPEKGKKVEIVPIGNHCRGTKFLNGNHLINEPLIKIIDNISAQIDGFYFGRYDLRCSSIDDLYAGKNIKIMELNGAGAEPAHIYQPGYSLFQAYKDIICHLKILMEITIQNKKKRISVMSFGHGVKELIKILKYNRQKIA